MTPIHNCRYSKALFQSHPRICLVCGQPEFESEISHSVDTNEMIEISDEEIKSMAEKKFPIKDDMYQDLWSQHNAFIEGCKAYRESIKTKK